MPESEASFADRAQKSRVLHDACAGFAPAYAAPPQGVTLAMFDAKVTAADGSIIAVDNADAPWSEVVEQRTQTAGLIKPTATQLLNYIKSSTAWKLKAPKAKQLADAIRGIKLPRAALPPPPPGEPAPARTQRGGQSYAEMETNWRALVTLATGLPGFAPTDVKIQAGTLNGLLSSLKGANESIPVLEAALSEARQDRQKVFYEEEAGLEFLFQTVKTTVKGQYGTASTQWAQVKGMKW